MDKNLVFGTADGDKVTFLTIAKKKINVPPFGVLTAEEAVKREEVLRHLVANQKTFPVLRELTTEESKVYQDSLERASEDIPEATEEDNELEAAQAEYEELTGKKPGNKKLATLLKEIEAAKSKSE